MVAGLSALLLAQNPSRTPDDLSAIIRRSAADQIGNISEDILGFDQYYGYGRVNAYQALLENVSSIKQSNMVDSKFEVFPNPASDHLFIRSEMDFNEVRIINILGVELINKTVGTDIDQFKVDVSGLPKGLYIIHISDTESQQVRSKKYWSIKP